MKEIKKLVNIFLPFLVLLFDFPFYDEIIRHPFLRVSFGVVIVYTAIIFLTNIVLLFFCRHKSNYSLRVMWYICIVVCIVCDFAGLFVHFQESTVRISCYDSAYAISEFSNGDLYKIAEEEYRISVTITNNSSRSLQVKAKDVVSLELLEFTPYSQLDIINNYSWANGGDGLQNPLEFIYYMDTDSTLQNCESISDNFASVTNDAFYVIPPNDIKELLICVKLKEEGYYKLRVSINTYDNGKKYTDKVFNLECICKAGPFEKNIADYPDLFDRVIRNKFR